MSVLAQLVLMVVLASSSWTMVGVTLVYCWIDAAARKRSRAYRDRAIEGERGKVKWRFVLLIFLLSFASLATILSVIARRAMPA